MKEMTSSLCSGSVWVDWRERKRTYQVDMLEGVEGESKLDINMASTVLAVRCTARGYRGHGHSHPDRLATGTAAAGPYTAADMCTPRLFLLCPKAEARDRILDLHLPVPGLRTVDPV